MSYKMKTAVMVTFFESFLIKKKLVAAEITLITSLRTCEYDEYITVMIGL